LRARTKSRCCAWAWISLARRKPAREEKLSFYLPCGEMRGVAFCLSSPRISFAIFSSVTLGLSKYTLRKCVGKVDEMTVVFRGQEQARANNVLRHGKPKATGYLTSPSPLLLSLSLSLSFSKRNKRREKTGRQIKMPVPGDERYSEPKRRCLHSRAGLKNNCHYVCQEASERFGPHHF